MSESDPTRRDIRSTASLDDQPEKLTLAELLDAPVSRREPAPPVVGCMIGECIDERHPTLQARVLVHFIDRAGHAQDLWVPTLHGLAVRAADRVLMVHPVNGSEWIVTGVVDGFAERPRIDNQTAARLELKPDEALQVVTAAGEPIAEISQHQDGPMVRLLRPDVRVEFAGKLAIRAESIEFEAARGQVKLKASDDVVVEGEVVRLN